MTLLSSVWCAPNYTWIFTRSCYRDVCTIRECSYGECRERVSYAGTGERRHTETGANTPGIPDVSGISNGRTEPTPRESSDPTRSNSRTNSNRIDETKQIAKKGSNERNDDTAISRGISSNEDNQSNEPQSVGSYVYL